MVLPAVKICNQVTLENNALSERRVAAERALDCVRTGMRYLSVYV